MEHREQMLAKVDELRDAVGKQAKRVAAELHEELEEWEDVGARNWVDSNPRKAVALGVVVALVVVGLIALVV